MFTFPEQRPNEKVLVVIRKHAIVYVKIIIIFLVVIVLFLSIFLSIWFSYYSASDNSNATVIVSLFSCLYLLFGLLFSMIAWINEQFDLFVVTNQRLLDITQISFLDRTVSSTPLEQIQDATSHVQGLFATIMNFGNLEIQTAAGDASVFRIDHIHDPGSKSRRILDLVNERKKQIGANGNMSNLED